MLQITTLSSTPTQTILDSFNLAFSDYSIPMKLSLDQLEAKMDTEDVNKEISVGAFRDGKLVGFVLHGQRTVGNIKRAYNAGTGVIPEERGQGLTKRMYDFILPKLKEDGFGEVMLEVISNNIPAIKSYEGIGFKKVREIVCFRGEIDIKSFNQEVKIKQVEAPNFDELEEIGEIEPTWQNSKETILNIGKNALCFLAFFDDKVCGFAIVNSSSNRLLQIAVKQEKRNQGIGSALLNHIKDQVSPTISIINIDSRFESTLDFFERRNLGRFLVQREMGLVFRF
ncbi:MAG: GNAT family N-acetyltransferase [Saprospiraceae bacterium]